MKFKTFVLCKLLRRHQWKYIRPYSDFEVMFECKRCGMVWVPGVGVIDGDLDISQGDTSFLPGRLVIGQMLTFATLR